MLRYAALLLCCAPAPAAFAAPPAAGITWPADAGVVDVTRPPYGAVPDDGKDDTAAIQRALADHPSGNKIIYLPAGAYVVSDTLRWPEGAHGGVFMKRTILQGAGRERTTIRVPDAAPGWGDPKSPRAVLYTGHKPAQRFRNAVRDLSIDTGKGNPGAVGARFIANNQGTFRDVTIRSGDGAGVVGLDLGYTDENGPCLIKDVVVEGFDTGIRCAFAVDSLTFEGVTLRGPRRYGLHNAGQCVSVRDLRVEPAPGMVAAVYNQAGPGVLALDRASIRFGWDGRPAVLNEAVLYARRISSKRTHAIESVKPGEKVSTPLRVNEVEEFVSHAPLTLFPVAEPKGLDLPVKPTPEVPWGDLEKDWVSPAAFGGAPNDDKDDTDALQRALDSGKATVYLPNGTWTLDGTLVLRGKAHRLIGCEARLRGRGKIRFEDGAAPAVVVERIDQMVGVEHASRRTLVVRHSGMETYDTAPGGTGEFFAEDVVGGPWRIRGQRVWARQLNLEPAATKIVNDGGTLWILGYKTERGGTLCETINGGSTEIVGGFAYATSGPKPEPMFVVRDSAFSVTFGESCFNGNPFTTLVAETRGGETRTLKKGDAPGRTGGSMIPLFVARPEPQKRAAAR